MTGCRPDLASALQATPSICGNAKLIGEFTSYSANRLRTDLAPDRWAHVGEPVFPAVNAAAAYLNVGRPKARKSFTNC
jgi:hypothetical protein